MLTDRRLNDHYRAAGTQRRGGMDAAGTPVEMLDLVDREPEPEFVAMFNENLALAMRGLAEPTREVAILRMEGYEVREIAQQLDISVSSVERKLRVVRDAWERIFHD